MKKMLLASTSTIFGQKYLEYLQKEIKSLFSESKKILFIPFARPSGITHEKYTQQVKGVFHKLDLNVLDYGGEKELLESILECDGIFTGGGNSFLLLNKLYEHKLIPILKKQIESGIPYLGTSAGTNICGVSIGTTNDMPIIHVNSFKAIEILPFNINPHYLNPIKNHRHMGESRETRIKEFHKINDQMVLGLREGSFIEVLGDDIILKGPVPAIIFEKEKEKFEIEVGFNLKKII
tara:strand:- start:9746 stop:10453 length:708 start_codon:yes stop_codon:yes gene_type:complete